MGEGGGATGAAEAAARGGEVDAVGEAAQVEEDHAQELRPRRRHQRAE
jgi:hypothetical protein